MSEQDDRHMAPMSQTMTYRQLLVIMFEATTVRPWQSPRSPEQASRDEAVRGFVARIMEDNGITDEEIADEYADWLAAQG